MKETSNYTDRELNYNILTIQQVMHLNFHYKYSHKYTRNDNKKIKTINLEWKIICPFII